MSDLSTRTSGRLSGRSREEIDRDFRTICRTAADAILRIGYDLIEMRELCEHGEWLKWLQSVGWKERTAQNYMRVAEAWDKNPKLMAMGYTRTVALLAAPAELQEQAAEGKLDDKSAAEIKRLSKELRDSEQTNQNLFIELEKQNKTVNGLLEQLQDADKKIHDREEKLRERAKNPEIVEKIVEKIPDDYELLKKQLRLAEDAAEDAERRASEAMAQAQQALDGQADGASFEMPSAEQFISTVNVFFSACNHLPYAQDWIRALDQTDRRSVRLFTDSIWHWAEQMLKALDQADRLIVIPAEGAVGDE